MTSEVQKDAADLLKDFTQSTRSGRRHAVPEISFDDDKHANVISEKLQQMAVKEEPESPKLTTSSKKANSG